MLEAAVFISVGVPRKRSAIRDAFLGVVTLTIGPEGESEGPGQGQEPRCLAPSHTPGAMEEEVDEGWLEGYQACF